MRSFATLRMTTNLSSWEKRGITLDITGWRTMFPSIKSEADYDLALQEVADFFEREPKPGTPDADQFDLLAAVIADYEIKHWPIDNTPQGAGSR